MIINEPDEIQKARELLSDFENSSKHSTRVEQFDKAMELLNKYMRSNPNSELNERAFNIKKTYTKKVINQLSMDSQSTNPAEYGTYYFVTIAIQCSDVLRDILHENPRLKQIWIDFKTRYDSDIARFLKEYERSIKKRVGY